MKGCVAAVLAATTIVCLPERTLGQARGGGGFRSGGTATAPGRAPATSAPRGPVRGPLPSTHGTTSRLVMVHRRFADWRGRAPFRSSWLGLAVIDPYWLWVPSEADQPVEFAAAVPPMDERPRGGLQLDVDPRRALVYVDGLFAGIVDDFSGYYHHLEVSAGLHTIEIIAPGYEPLIVSVTVSPERTTTYRGTLNRP